MTPFVEANECEYCHGYAGNGRLCEPCRKSELLAEVVELHDRPGTGWARLASIWFDNLRPYVLGRTCSVHDCRSVASVVAHWPGQGGKLACEDHRAALAHIAEAMGFVLWTAPLEIRTPPAADPAVERFRLLEFDR